MNRSNVTHILLALGIQVTTTVICACLGLLFGYPAAGAIFGAALGGVGAASAFVSREHAHNQNDIADTTGVPVPEQNPLDGFHGLSGDAKRDYKGPIIACTLFFILLVAAL